MTSHKISQETFDETLLENQDLFDLTPEAAIEETISQFTQQGIQNLESYIITTHPDSDEGKEERATRAVFEGYLNVLDGSIAQDGSVSIDNSDKVLEGLEGVLNYCNGMCGKGANKFERAMPFLTLFHSSNSLFTFMSLLGIVSPDDKPTEEQIVVLRKLVQVMTNILTPQKASEREIKTLIKDKFMVMERLVKLIDLFVQLCKEDVEHASTLSLLVTLAGAACRNSERNKVSFVRALKNSTSTTENTSTIALLIQGLIVAVEAYKVRANQDVVCLTTEYCKLISVLCRYDDFRPEGSGGGLGVDSSYGMNVSSSHDHVQEFNRNGVVPVLHDITLIALTTNVENLSDGTTEEDVVSLAGAALSATRVLAVNDESVQALVAVGILKVVKLALEMGVKEVIAIAGDDITKQDQLKTHRQHLTAGAIGLVRNLCGNDEIKTSLCLGTASDPASCSLYLVLEGMRLYRDNALIQEHGCGSLAAMALRKPANALRIVQENGPREILAAMGKFPNNVLVQRQGALAVRNIVARLVANTSAMEVTGSDENSIMVNQTESINVRDVFLDLGAEVILRQITGRHQGSVDEAFAALRDLGCKISMVKFDTETQTVTRKTEVFGETTSNFRAVYDDSDAGERIDNHVADNK